MVRVFAVGRRRVSVDRSKRGPQRWGTGHLLSRQPSLEGLGVVSSCADADEGGGWPAYFRPRPMSMGRQSCRGDKRASGGYFFGCTLAMTGEKRGWQHPTSCRGGLEVLP